MVPTGWHAIGNAIESGQSWLYRARRDGDEGEYALKCLKNTRRAARFAREVTTMASLHERGVGVPEVVASDLDARRPWFAMPWFPDGSLEAAVEDRRYVTDLVGGLRTLDRLAATLSDVHCASVAHRDLKPANVLIAGEEIALTDFGLCLELPET